MDMATIRNAHWDGAPDGCGGGGSAACASAGRRATQKKNSFRGLLLDALGGFLGTVAGDVLSEFHDDAVVNDAVDGGGGGPPKCRGVVMGSLKICSHCEKTRLDVMMTLRRS